MNPSFALMLALACSMAPGTGGARPNIIFILADDLGYGDLGCQGQRLIKTPRLDQMASEGIRFTSVYAGSTVCAPSRGCLMTGMHTGHGRVRGNGMVPLAENDFTIARTLLKAGYRTGLVGKWGLGEEGSTGVPNKQGFETFFGFLNQNHAHNYYPDFLYRDEKREAIPGNVVANGVASKKARYAPDLFTQEAFSFIQKNRGERFFLYLAYTIPHANNEAARETGNGMEVPDLGIYADTDWPAPSKGFAAMVTRMDRDIGRLFDLLKQLGLDERTIVFFSSDNGPHREGGRDPRFFSSGAPLRGGKRDLYEGGIRVPMLVRWPGVIRPGQVNDSPWAFWDVLPTLADLAGAPIPPNLDGTSVTALFKGEAMTPHAPFYWEFHEGGFSQAARIGQWKGVRRQSTESAVELFDLSKDIAEEHDLAARRPDLVDQMKRFWQTTRTESTDWPIRNVGVGQRAKRRAR